MVEISAEKYIKKAIELQKNEGNYYDTYAEILLKMGKLDTFYENITLALKYPNKIQGVTTEGYKKDKRWVSVINTPKFQAILKQASKQ